MKYLEHFETSLSLFVGIQNKKERKTDQQLYGITGITISL
jgi:hypothetical protein